MRQIKVINQVQQVQGVYQKYKNSDTGLQQTTRRQSINLCRSTANLLSCGERNLRALDFWNLGVGALKNWHPSIKQNVYECEGAMYNVHEDTTKNVTFRCALNDWLLLLTYLLTCLLWLLASDLENTCTSISFIFKEEYDLENLVLSLIFPTF